MYSFISNLWQLAVYKGVEPLPQDRQSSILTVIRIHHSQIAFCSLVIYPRKEQNEFF